MGILLCQNIIFGPVLSQSQGAGEREQARSKTLTQETSHSEHLKITKTNFNKSILKEFFSKIAN